MKLVLLTVLMLTLNTCLVNAQGVSTFDEDITNFSKSIICKTPDQQFPVSVEARLISDSRSDSVAVVVKVKIADGWHIYEFVPENMPYLPTEYILDVDNNITKAGIWQKSEAIESPAEKGVMFYENEAIFIHKLKKSSPTAKGQVNTGLYYQCCNLFQCMPPVEKAIKLNY